MDWSPRVTVRYRFSCKPQAQYISLSGSYRSSALWNNPHIFEMSVVGDSIPTAGSPENSSEIYSANVVAAGVRERIEI